MPMVAILTLVNAEASTHMVIIFGDFGGQLGLFTCSVANLMSFADPATLGLENAVFEVFILCHILPL